MKIADGYLQSSTGVIGITPNNSVFVKDQKSNSFMFSKYFLLNRTKEVFKNVLSERPGVKASKVQVFDLIKDGRHEEFIMPNPENFFGSFSEAMNVLDEMPELRSEIMKHDKCAHVPFMNKENKYYMMLVYYKQKLFQIYTFKLKNKIVLEVAKGNIFILPYQDPEQWIT